ncbi:hypothetical protein [Dyella sp.]|uniref:hypothetical protein n=1 Tax=Dyella sp. TaxID=1869338 RepID=UPI002FDB2514
MPLPRHLQGRFDDKNGAPISTDQSGDNATTSDDPNATTLTDSTSTALPADDTATTTPADDSTAAHTDATTTATTPQDVSTDDGDGKKDANYARMEGRYKAQLRRQEEQIAELKEQARGASTLTDLLMQTRQELAALQAANKSATSNAQEDADTTALTADEQQLYGDFAPVAQKLVERATAPLRAEIEALRSKTGAVGEEIGKTAEQVFVGHVRTRVPGFDDIRNNPDWAAFLEKPIPLTSHTLGSALQEAHNARDLDRVVSIFHAFTSGQNPATTQADSTATQTQPATTKAKPGLEQFATPDRTAANPPGKPKAQFQDSDYRARLNDMRAGRVSKEQFLQFEKEFYEAKRAGRVSS